MPFAVLRNDVALEFDFAPADAERGAPPPPPPLEEAEPPRAAAAVPAPVGLLIAMSLAIALAARARARWRQSRGAPREDAREVLIVHLPPQSRVSAAHSRRDRAARKPKCTGTTTTTITTDTTHTHTHTPRRGGGVAHSEWEGRSAVLEAGS